MNRLRLIDKLRLRRSSSKSVALYYLITAFLFILPTTLLAQAPYSSSSIIFDTQRQGIWNVNPHNDSVTATLTEPATQYWEIKVGKSPQNLAIDISGNIWVTNIEDSTISVINGDTGLVQTTIALHPGSEPFGIVTDTHHAYVSTIAEGTIYRINLQDRTYNQQHDKIYVGTTPYALAIAPKTNTLLATQLIPEGSTGKVYRINTAAFNSSSVEFIDLGENLKTGEFLSRRMSLLQAIAIHPNNETAWVSMQLDFSNGEKLTRPRLNFIPAIATIDLNLNRAQKIDSLTKSQLNTITAIAPIDQGKTLLFTHESSGSVSLWDASQSTLNQIIPFGLGPRGMTLHPNTQRVYIHNQLSRRVNSLHIKSIKTKSMLTNSPSNSYNTNTLKREPMNPTRSLGEQLFYTSFKGVSCNNCHFRGEQDGGIWRIEKSDRKLNTPNLKSIYALTLKDKQDSPPLSNETRQASLIKHSRDYMAVALSAKESRALSKYLRHLDDQTQSPHRKQAGELSQAGDLSQAAKLGRQLFMQRQCSSCHSGLNFSDDALGYQHQLKPTASAEFSGTATSSLKNLWKSAPYFRDGSAKSLRQVLSQGNHGQTKNLNNTEKDNLIAYLLSIDEFETSPQLSSNMPYVDTYAHTTIFSNKSIPFYLSASNNTLDISQVDWLVNGQIQKTTKSIAEPFLWSPPYEGQFKVAARITHSDLDAISQTPAINITYDSSAKCTPSSQKHCPVTLRDTDNDGTPNSYDACANTQAGASTDVIGCPRDSDNDGVLDGIDACPGSPRGTLITLNGCSLDSDGDGILDGIDACDNTLNGSIIDEEGCPRDSDGDYVPDGVDHCPATPANAIIDDLGCPSDQDKDGIFDGIDRCPLSQQGAEIDKYGCPKVTHKVTLKRTHSQTTGSAPNLLIDGSFDLGQVMFETHIENPANTVSWDKSAHFSILEEDIFNHWAVQLNHYTLLNGGTVYTLCFDARADKNRRIHVDISQGVSTEQSLLQNDGQYYDITTAMQQYQLTDKVTQTGQDTRLYFNLAESTGEVWLDNIGLYQGETCGKP